MQIQNLTLSLTDDCRLVPRGCYLIKNKVTAAQVDYFVSKPPMFNKNGTEDFCQSLEDATFQDMASKYKNIDSKCPIEAGHYCFTKGSTLIEKLNPTILNMAVGTVKGMVNFESENVKGKTCIEMEAVISKRKG